MVFGFPTWSYDTVRTQPVLDLILLDGIKKVGIGVRCDSVTWCGVVAILMKRTFKHPHVVRIDVVPSTYRALKSVAFSHDLDAPKSVTGDHRTWNSATC